MISPEVVEGNTITFLNEKGHSFVCGQDFVYNPRTGTCPGYQSMDPRTFDSPRAIRTTYDRPPLFSKNTQPLQNLYTSPGAHTGFYPSYQAIKNGDLFYYTDRDVAEPYGLDPYTLTSYTIPQIEIDPMGAYRPLYQKVPVFQNNRNVAQYTFDQDQMQFREDLMALQSRKINESDFAMFQLYNDPQTYFKNGRLVDPGTYPYPNRCHPNPYCTESASASGPGSGSASACGCGP